MPTTRKALGALVVLTFVLAFAACSDGDDSSAAPSPPSESPPVDGGLCAAALAIELAPPPDVDFETATADEIAEGLSTYASEVMRPLADDVVAATPDEVAEQAAVLSAAVDAMAETGDPTVWDQPDVVAASDAFDAFVDGDCGWAVLDVTADEFVFEGIPAELDAGPTRFRLDNEGGELHEVLVLRIDDDTEEEIDEILALPQEDALELVTPMGAPAFADPGGQDVVVYDLIPGRYVAVCMIPEGLTSESDEPAPGAVPHAAHGMITPFTVS